MAIVLTSVNYINPDFDSGGSTPVNYLRGHISENITIQINFETTNPIGEINLFTNFIKNSDNLYPTAGSFEIPDSYFQSLSTGDTQSFRGIPGTTLNPNNVIKWREGTVQLSTQTLGGIGSQYTITINTKITPLILENQLTVLGIPAVGLVPYLAGAESLKHVFRIDCFTNIGDTTPIETTQSIDLSSIILNGNVGFFNEFLNGNLPNHELQYLNRNGQTWTGRVKNNVGAWSVSDKFILKSFRVVEGSFNEAFTLDENHYYNELIALTDGVNVNDSLFTDLVCTINGTDNTILDISFTAERRFFENRGRYILAANCGQPTASEATNKRTVLRLTQFEDAKELNTDLFQFAPIGIGLNKVVFNYHETDDLNDSFDNIAGYLEDIIVSSANIRIPRGTTDRDNVRLLNLRVSIESNEQPILEQRSFLVEDNTNQSYNRGFELLSNDFRNTITFQNTLIESRNNFGAIYIPTQYILRRFDGGSFITDGFTVGSAIAITGEIVHNSTIAGVTDGDITLVDPLSIQYLNEHWDITIDGTNDYFNVVRTDNDLNYKEYALKFPFKLTWDDSPININLTTLTGLKFVLTATIIQSFWNKTNVTQDFTYTVDDFTVYDYSENNPNDTTITGIIETFDEFEVTNQNEFLTSDAVNLIRARFNQTGLNGLLSKANGIIRLGNADSLSQFFIRDHSSIRANKDNEFTSALTTVTSPGVDNIDLKAFIEGSLLDDLNYKLSARLDIEDKIFTFLTDFDPLTDGTFDPSASGGGVSPLWTFQDSSTIASYSISTTGNGLDGTLQVVKYQSSDLANISSIDVSNDQIQGVLNLSVFNGGTASPIFNIFNNLGIEKVIFPSRTGNMIGSYIRAYILGVTELDFSPFDTEFGGRVFGFSNSNLTTIINPTSTANTFNTIDFNNCVALGSGPLIDYSGFTNILEGVSFSMRFDNCNLTQAQVDKLLIDVDNNSTNAFAGRSVNLGGTNAAPSASGVTAKNNLIAKGFTVTTN